MCIAMSMRINGSFNNYSCNNYCTAGYFFVGLIIHGAIQKGVNHAIFLILCTNLSKQKIIKLIDFCV